MLADYRTAPIDAKLRSTLGLLEKLTKDPDSVTATDFDPLYAAGVSDEAIDDAIHVMALFNMIVRIADAFEFGIPTADQLKSMAKGLLQRGYR